MNYNIIVEFPYSSLQGEIKTSNGFESILDPDQRLEEFETPTIQDEEVILNYDGHNFDAIGLTAGGTFHVAARFPADMVGQYAGYIFESVDVYIKDSPTNLVLKIWEAGTANSPGKLVHHQSHNAFPQSWNTIQIIGDVILDGTDFWVGYEVTHGNSQQPAGCDAGPANPNGDWISLDGDIWEHLAGYGLNYNWNIRAKIKSFMPPWLVVEPLFGSISAGNFDVVSILANLDLLNHGENYAYIKIYSNDPQNELLIATVLVDYAPLIEDINSNDFISCYPVPASEKLYLEFKLEVTDFRIINPMGQLVLSYKAEDEKTSIVDVSQLLPGIYLLQADAKDGKVFSRKILISRQTMNFRPTAPSGLTDKILTIKPIKSCENYYPFI